MKTEIYLTQVEAAELLRISPRTLERYRVEGKSKLREPATTET